MIRQSSKQRLFSGGLAEIVSHPSPLTFSFLQHWFSGENSLGRALHLLGLPYTESSVGVLRIMEGQLYVDLDAEMECMYKNTVFRYKDQLDAGETPQLGISGWQFFNPVAVWNTGRILLYQSRLIATPETYISLAEMFLGSIPDHITDPTVIKTDLKLSTKVWPYVLAIGMLSEFYSQYVIMETKKTNQEHEVLAYMGSQISKDDWFFQSLTDMYAVKIKRLAFDIYMHRYGLRGDVDYEIACPRWKERPFEVQSRIEKSIAVPPASVSSISLSPSLEKYVRTAISLQIIRNKARTKALYFIDVLRQLIREKYQLSDEKMATLDRDYIISGSRESTIGVRLENEQITKDRRSAVTEGHGRAISVGVVTGSVMHITSGISDVPEGVIGVFPNASPEFSLFYPRCRGMIFLLGGQTSHGAIVAREYGIPALIDANGQYIPNNAMVEIDGGSGEWKVIS